MRRNSEKRFRRSIRALLLGLATIQVTASVITAAEPTLEYALSLKPTQTGLTYDVPAENERTGLEVKTVASSAGTGWVVTNESGQLLRKFVDTNKDGKVDLWSYYRAGVEVYRDIDTDGNNTAEQFRWLGPAGLRWGVDTNGDRKVDRWNQISAQEVSQEVVAAIKTKDAARFARLLLTDAELRDLGVGKARFDALAKMRADALATFERQANTQQLITQRSSWVHFSGLLGVIPSGTSGSTKDVTVYDNVMTIVESAGEHHQMVIGAMIQAGKNWRLVNLPPALATENTVAYSGYFFKTPGVSDTPAVATGNTGNEAMQKLVGQLEEIDIQLAKAQSQSQQASLNVSRVEVLKQLAAKSATVEQRNNWIRQLADTVTAAVQTGAFPDGVAHLESLYDSLRASKDTPNTAYVRFRMLTADYGQKMQKPNAEFEEIQDQWLKDLALFVQQYPTSADAAEATLQIAIGEEFAGDHQAAINWYSKIVQQFPKSPLVAKAKGAALRLQLPGRMLTLKGTTLSGSSLTTASSKGKVTIVHYWATLSPSSVQDMLLLKQFQAKYGASKLALVGVNLDMERNSAEAALQANRITWGQLYSRGGMESELANQLGIVSLPTMLLIDQQGKVISSGVHMAELDSELQKLIR